MMNKVLLGASLTVTLLVSACSQGPAEVPGGLEAQFGSPRDDYANVVTTDVQRGRVYVGGAYTGPANSGRGDVLFFQSYSRDGRFAWKTSANVETPNTRAYVDAADVDRAGNVFFGWTEQENAQDTYVITSFISKYSPTGTRLFRAELKGRNVRGLALDGAGSVYVAGRADGAAGGPEYVRKYTGSGKLVWEKLMRYADISYVTDLDVAADGSVYLVGLTAIPDEAETVPTMVRLRGSDGKLLRRGVVGDAILYGKADDVAVSGNAVYVVTSDDSSSIYFLTKARLDGSSIWERRVAPDGAVDGLSADAQGSAYLTGTLFGSTQTDYYDYFALKYTPSGSVAFNKAFRDPATDAEARGIGVADPGELYLVGSTDGTVNGKTSGGREAFLTRLNAQGQKVWER